MQCISLPNWRVAALKVWWSTIMLDCSGCLVLICLVAKARCCLIATPPSSNPHAWGILESFLFDSSASVLSNLCLRYSHRGGILCKSQNMLLFAWMVQLLTRHFIKLDPTKLQTDAEFLSYPSMCSDLDKSPCVQNVRTISSRRALYPRWVLSRGNGTLICISRQPRLFAPFLLQWSSVIVETSKHQTSLSLVHWLVRYSMWLLKK